jgi:cell division protein FtsB
MECKHRQLARSCEICERDAEIDRLTARVAELEAENRDLKDAFRKDRDWIIRTTIDAAVDALMAEQEAE